MPTDKPEEMTDEQAQAEWDKLDAEEEGTAGDSLAQTLQTDAPDEEPVPEEPEFKPIQPEAKALLKVEPEAPKDPLQAINEAIAQLARAVEQQGRDVRAINGKFGGLADQLKQVKAESTVAKAAAAPGGPSQAEIDAASKDPAEWDTLKGEFPEWATAVEKYVAVKVQAGVKTPAAPAIDIDSLLKDRLPTMVSEAVNTSLRQAREQEALQRRVTAQINEAHPDWMTTAASAEFNAWKASQAPGIRALADSEDPADAIEMLNLYAAVKPSTKTSAEVTQQRQERLNKSVVPSKSVSPGPRATVALSDLDDDQLWKYYDRQDDLAAAAEAKANR